MRVFGVFTIVSVLALCSCESAAMRDGDPSSPGATRHAETTLSVPSLGSSGEERILANVLDRLRAGVYRWDLFDASRHLFSEDGKIIFEFDDRLFDHPPSLFPRLSNSLLTPPPPPLPDRAVDDDGHQQLGFGAIIGSHRFAGQRATIKLKVLAVQPAPNSAHRIAEWRMQVYGEDGADGDALHDRVEAALRHSFDEPDLRSADPRDASWRSEHWHGVMQRSIERELGTAAAVQPPAELADRLAELSSPFTPLMVAGYYGEGGSQSHGFALLSRLRELGRVDIVRALLRSKNPELRIFAAAALTDVPQHLTEDDRRAIDRIRFLPILVPSARGCSFEQESANNALERVSGDFRGQGPAWRHAAQP